MQHGLLIALPEGATQYGCAASRAGLRPHFSLPQQPCTELLACRGALAGAARKQAEQAWNFGHIACLLMDAHRAVEVQSLTLSLSS